MNEFVIARPMVHPVAAATAPSLFALGLWVRLGFIGACLVLSALISWSDRSATLGTVFWLGAGGLFLALVSWQRLRKAFAQERFDEVLARRSPH